MLLIYVLSRFSTLTALCSSRFS